jgi:fatty-acyl-CoA synthase
VTYCAPAEPADRRSAGGSANANGSASGSAGSGSAGSRSTGGGSTGGGSAGSRSTGGGSTGGGSAGGGSVGGGSAGELDERYWDERALQGKPLPWTELRLVDDDGREVAWDGESSGEIQVRGPWIASRYYNDPSGDDKFEAGWLRTGDIAAIDEQAFVRITDRSKDVIKSGGEWISSVELENELMAHPDVIEAAVIAKPDERWAERPLCCVVLREGAEVGAPELLEHLRPRVAKWWLPDEFAFIPEVPKTSVGKFDKKVLRARLRAGELEGRVAVGAAPSGQSASSTPVR